MAECSLPGSNHYPEYDIEKCPHPLLSLSLSPLPVIGPTERADHCISRRNIEFQCLILPPKDQVWWSQAWNYLLLSPVNTSDVSSTLNRSQLSSSAALSRRKEIKIQKSLLILTFLRQLFHNGQFVRIYLNLELNIREAVGFQLNSPKWYFYTNVVQTFQFTLNGLNSGQVQKSFCPGLAWILIHYRPELGFLTIFSPNIWHEGEVISGYLTSV